MSITTFSSRESDQGTIGTRHAVGQRPVVITDRGESTQVPLTYERHKPLALTPECIVDLLGMSEAIKFEPPRAGVASRPAYLI